MTRSVWLGDDVRNKRGEKFQLPYKVNLAILSKLLYTISITRVKKVSAFQIARVGK